MGGSNPPRATIIKINGLKMDNKSKFLEVTEKIAYRLVNSAIYSNNKCSWIVNVPDRKTSGVKKSIEEKAGGTVYQGTAGIALFLLELYKITNEKIYGKTAEGAMNFALEEADKMPNNSFGFYSGRVGIGYTLYKASQVFQQKELLQKGEEIIKSLIGNEKNDYGLDVISGAASAVPALLKMAEISGGDIELKMAIALGENLIKKANMEPTGWSWGGGNSNYRNLCGFAHGASGFGHAFLELYNFTADEKYLYAAEQAFLYERQFFNKEKLNWPDFRYSELSEYIYEERIEQLKEVLKKGGLTPYENKYMYAWCHGSPGIALSRLRAYEVTGMEAYKEEAELAVEGTKLSLTNQANYSLCHGIGGNCEALIYAGRLLNDKDAFELAEEYASNGINKYENQNEAWPCGTMGGVQDPSLMLGEAGIGYFLLRLYSSEIDSVLLLQPSLKGKTESGKDNLKELREKYTDVYFSKTKKYFKSIGGESVVKDLPDINELIGKKESDVELFYKNIQKYVDSLLDEEKNKFEDFFKLEKEKYLQTLEIKDFSEEFRQSLIKKEAEEINWLNSTLSLSKTSKLIEQKYNWSKWLENTINRKLEEPEEVNNTIYCLNRTTNSI